MNSRNACRQVVAVALLLVAGLFGAAVGAQAVNVTGDWTFNVQTDLGSGTPAITFKQDGETLTGTYNGQLGNTTFKGTVKGTAIEFSFTTDAQGQTVDVVYRGTVEKDTVKGTVTMAGGQVNGTFTGNRKK
jgi:hypothetical protein